ncbi:MAG: hypothetical protein Q4B50_07355 [Bacillota bacterium]|nr:hypothetical protein [Bacillota bacterium]
MEDNSLLRLELSVELLDENGRIIEEESYENNPTFSWDVQGSPWYWPMKKAFF